ncbi:hypothetical protein HDU98_003971 [Podochytrium sp. JEL0797]|nr:hypothetical protein HDU98_003971 [Podochytrium sp. JEL0797]
MHPLLFQQTAPEHPSNAFLADRVLMSIVQRRGAQHSKLIHDDLARFSTVLASPEVKQNSHAATIHLPQLRQFTPWGQRIDQIDTSHGWKSMKDLSAVEGLIATGYERHKYPLNPSAARVHQFAKLFLFSPVSALYTCPLAMTDGAARVLELSSGDEGVKEVREEYLPRLVSRDPTRFVTSGQWMTEKPGGSDVGNSETVAMPVVGAVRPEFVVKGQKWFSSATDADITFLLAREGIPSESSGLASKGPTTKSYSSDSHTFHQGSKGLSLFFAPIWIETPASKQIHHHAQRSVQSLNGIQIVALKNKHGTKQLPTAELSLTGLRAVRVGPAFKGVKTVATMLNITRLHAAVGTVAGFRHVLFLARDFAKKRSVFGKVLARQPLQARVLADLEVTTAALMRASFYVVQLLGVTETMGVREDAVLLRFLTPVIKAWVSKTSNAGIAECMEALGGVGYIEETGVSAVLRDQAVNMIWEGATNVMALDVVRVLVETKGEAARIFQERLTSILVANNPTKTPRLATLTKKLESELASFRTRCDSAVSNEVESRTLLFHMGYLIASVLLVDEAAYSGDVMDIAIAERWVLNCGVNGFQFGVGGYEKGEEVFAKEMDYLVAFGAKL